MSTRGLIRSMTIIGSAQMVNIAISILRMKLLAVLLGPAGVGLLGIFSSLQQTASMTAGLGLGLSGVRQVAANKEDNHELSIVQSVLLWGNVIQGLIAVIVVWSLREWLAIWLLGDDTWAVQIGMIGVTVLLMLIAASQTALLQGLRRIGDLGWVTVIGAVSGTICGLIAVWFQGLEGLIWFLMIQPLSSIFVAFYFTRRLPSLPCPPISIRKIWSTWHEMASLGVIFMLGALASTATLLLVRSWIAQTMGLEAAGQFSAAWGITIQYLGFLLGAMAADYYPRLTETIKDQKATHALINDQTQLGLALGGPILLAMIGLAPWMISLLYSAEFSPAIELVQWQTVGNIFKLASWPLGFAFVAAAHSRVFLAIELFWNGLYLAIIWFGSAIFGLSIAGVGFMFAYVLYFALNYLLISRLMSFRLHKLSIALIFGHASLAVLLLLLARTAPVTGAVASVILALTTGIIGVRVIVVKIGTTGRITAKLAKVFVTLGWPLKATDEDNNAPS